MLHILLVRKGRVTSLFRVTLGKDIMWAVRLYYLEKFVLPQWKQFTIWSAGKQGRKLFRSLSKSNQQKGKIHSKGFDPSMSHPSHR